jgi:hypothetical protein
VGPYKFDKKQAVTRYTEHVFLHSVGSTGHVVHSCVSRARNMMTLFFMIGWERYGFDKKRAEARDTELVFLHPMGSTGHVVHSRVSRA